MFLDNNHIAKKYYIQYVRAKIKIIQINILVRFVYIKTQNQDKNYLQSFKVNAFFLFLLMQSLLI